MTRYRLHIRPRGGFTLLELTLAMAMAAMLALSLYTAMNVALRARRTAINTVEPSRAVRIAADICRTDLESVPPPTGILAGSFLGEHQAGPMGGDADALQFHSIGRDAQNDGLPMPMGEGIRRVELLVRSDVTPPVLVRRVTRNLLPSAEPQVEEEILCRDVVSFTLRYFDGLSWIESWDSTTMGDVLPLAVMMELRLSGPDPSQPLVNAPVATRIIPLSCAKPADTLSMEALP